MNGARGPHDARRDTIWAYGILLCFSALYFLSFFNRFAGLRSGNGEFQGGIALLGGWLPYRDFYTAGPPLNGIKAAIELTLFGKALIVSRACAVAERLAIGALLYAWLRRNFSAWASCIAALATIVVSAGDLSDPLASYNHDAILFAMLCGFAASLSLEAVRPRFCVLLAGAAGIAVGLSSLTKQTIGLGTAVAVLVIGGFACARIFGIRRSTVWAVAYVVGFAVPVLAVASYLAHLGVLTACLRMMFVTGPGAKASSGPFVFLVRELALAEFYGRWFFLGALCLALVGRAIGQRIRAAEPAENPRASDWRWMAAISLLAIGGAELLAMTSLPVPLNVTKAAVYFAFIGTALFGVYATDCALRAESAASVRLWQIVLFAAVGWSVAFTLSLSWPCFEAMALPGLALLLAAAVEGVRPRMRWVLYCALALLVALAVLEKLNVPFSFGTESELPVRMASARSSLPELKGMRFPPATERLLDETVPLMHAAAVAHHGVFTYPEFGLVYPLSGAMPPTFAGSHNIDAVPDTVDRADAARLLKNPPRVILYSPSSEEFLRNEEGIWRNGKPSGQRALVAAIEQLLPDYRLVDTFTLRPGDPPIQLYVRKDTAPSTP